MRLPCLLTASLLFAPLLVLPPAMLADTLPSAVGNVYFTAPGSSSTFGIPPSDNYISYTNNLGDVTQYAAIRGGTDTAVQATISNTAETSPDFYAVSADLLYFFMVVGPAGQSVPIDISAFSVVGGSSGLFAETTFGVYENLSGASPMIYLDPCQEYGSFVCGDGSSGFTFDQTLNVLTNTAYYIQLDAEVGQFAGGMGGTAFAYIDPTISLDTTDPAYSLTFSPNLIPTTATPELSSLLLLGTGIAGIFARRRMRLG